MDSLNYFKHQARLRSENEAGAEKRMLKLLLEKHHEEVRGIHFTKRGGTMVAVTYAARDKDSKHFTRHKAGLRQVEGRIEILEVVNT
jgi:hypothetical protein